MYKVQDNGRTDTYHLMQGNELNPRFPSPVYENIETMVNDGAAEYVVDPSLYYPAAPGYGYYCTGYESPGGWDDNHAVFGLDAADIQYAAAQTENSPYVYYTPSYGYGESGFNPYNPYIPGAMIGVDGSCVPTQSYYMSPYPDSVSSSGYYPVLVQPDPNVVASSSTNTISDVGPSTTHRVNASSVKRTHPSAPATMIPSKAASSQTHSVTVGPQGSKPSTGSSKRPVSNRSSGSGVSIHGVSSHSSQNGNGPGPLQSPANTPYGKLLPQANHVKYTFPLSGGVSGYGSSTNGHAFVNDPWSKDYYRRAANDVNGNCDPLSEQNRGPRTNRSKNQLIVKSYTTKAGDRDSEGNIVIYADQYNKGDFQVDYVNAKFFVIKSYSEDDVHKSIKYNVWSSTPNGNKKLNIAYEDAQKVAAGSPRGCPIYLFFSVNASGQFCGMAEMAGPVDFDKDMDFWQQDKWSGSFPVKWHFIKDVPNTIFRNITLENNEHKSVTNSRDTQEIFFKPGLQMLKMFKNYLSKTSLLDDFLYYESRQKIMLEERARLLRRANGHVRVAVEAPPKLNSVLDRPRKEEELSTWVEKGAQSIKPTALEKTKESATEVSSSVDVDKSGVSTTTKQKASEAEPGDVVSTIKIGSLSIHPKQTERSSNVPASSSAAVPRTAAAAANIVTVGSMPIKVDGVKRSSGMLTIGTFALDPKAIQQGKMGSFAKGDLRK